MKHAARLDSVGLDHPGADDDAERSVKLPDVPDKVNDGAAGVDDGVNQDDIEAVGHVVERDVLGDLGVEEARQQEDLVQAERLASKRR